LFRAVFSPVTERSEAIFKRNLRAVYVVLSRACACFVRE